MIDETNTIAQARDHIRPLLKKGTTCPCCSQPVKMYSRPITASMAYGLILIFNTHKQEWVHLESFFKSITSISPSIRADIPKLRFWFLIEPKEGEKTDGNPNNGYYRLTDKGKAFVEGTTLTNSHVNLYNNQFYGIPKNARQIDIRDALKTKFIYSEIIGK